MRGLLNGLSGFRIGAAGHRRRCGATNKERLVARGMATGRAGRRQGTRSRLPGAGQGRRQGRGPLGWVRRQGAGPLAGLPGKGLASGLGHDHPPA